jgi:hypothetical protein
LRDVKADIERRGAKLWIVGHGAPHFAQAFAEEAGLQGSVLTDPDRLLYRALGMKHGMARSIRPQAAKNLVRALLRGHRQTGIRGDAWQQGGAAVVSKDGELTYVYVSDAAGDHAPVKEVLRAIPN